MNIDGGLTHPHTHTPTHHQHYSAVHIHSSLGSPSLRSLTHSLRSVRPLTSATPNLPASPVHSYGGGARVCVMGGLPPLWFIEHRCAVGGRYPPRYRRSILTAGVPGCVLWGVYPPLLVYRASLRRWGAVPPRYPRATPRYTLYIYIIYTHLVIIWLILRNHFCLR